MNIFFTTRDFRVDGIPYSGFPVLVDKFGNIVEVVLLFFIDILLANAGASDLKTWDAYGRHMYDYFGFLEARNLDWKFIPQAQQVGTLAPISHYSNWCSDPVGNQAGYINDKLRTVKRFYKWAVENHYMERLPFRFNPSAGGQQHGAGYGFAHNPNSSPSKSNVDRKESTKVIRVLSRQQTHTVLDFPKNATHQAVLHTFLMTGLRAEEAATFPEKYVVDCSRLHKDVKSVRVTLNPKDMRVKNDKERTIPVPISCMNLLWQYRATVRPLLEERGERKSRELFLTRDGLPYELDGFDKPFERLGQKVGLHLYPHLFRHTFATHTLNALEDLKRRGKLQRSPIHILQKALGHSKVSTTLAYTHLLDYINDEYGTWYQSEIDQLAVALIPGKGDDGKA